MKISIAGHRDPLYSLPEHSFKPGDEVALNPDLAAAWIANGFAVAVKEG
jgi:hypothetical protein